MAELRIGELARKLGLNPKTLRYYEDVGVIPPPRRSESGYRLYAEDDEARLAFVAGARRAGFRLGEVKEILALRDRGEAPCEFVRGTLARRRRELDRQIGELERLRTELATLEERAAALPPQSSGRFCHIIEAA